jgi:hypothetical protein
MQLVAQSLMRAITITPSTNQRRISAKRRTRLTPAFSTRRLRLRRQHAVGRKNFTVLQMNFAYR